MGKGAIFAMQKRIIIDAMGGDNAPLEILKGTYLAQKEYGIAPVLVGNDKEIQKCIKDNNIALENVKIKKRQTHQWVSALNF